MSEQDPGIDIPPSSIPHHVAIIMDGNNRWAKRHGIKGIGGHKEGVEAVRDIVEACSTFDIKVLTLFAFSSENWQRPKHEVRGLMELFFLALKREVKRLKKNRVQLRVIGDRSKFSAGIQKRIIEAEQSTAENAERTLVVAADYGGQWDITQAARRIAQDVEAGIINSVDVDEAMMQKYICMGDLPAPDLLIRTGGEHRISNFLLWQSAYTELYFTEDYWPDFRAPQLEAAIREFGLRQRRFGKTSEQVVETDQ